VRLWKEGSGKCQYEAPGDEKFLWGLSYSLIGASIQKFGPIKRKGVMQ
jgi:hypothetical protein